MFACKVSIPGKAFLLQTGLSHLNRSMSGATREQREFSVVNGTIIYSLSGVGIVKDRWIGNLAIRPTYYQVNLDEMYEQHCDSRQHTPFG